MRPARPLLLFVAASICACLLLSPPSASQAPPAFSASVPAHGGKQFERLAKAVEKLAGTVGKLGGKLGVSIIDVETGRTIAAVNEVEPLNPASNMKLLTAATALWQLGASHQYRTGLYGRRNGPVVDELVLRSYGDPSLSTADLWELVSELKRSGVRRIQGDILVDQSYFDDAYLPPGFEQQPNEWAYFRAPICAVPLNRNAVTMTVTPASANQPAVVAFDPPGFVDVTSAAKTGSAGAENITLVLTPSGARLSAKVAGSIPEAGHPVTATRRIDNPATFAGFALRALLAEQGISVSGGVRVGGEKARDALAMHRSKALSELLYELGKRSDNFYAEMIFKSLGGKDKVRGLTTVDGAETVAKYLRAVGALDSGTVIKNGSGLFDSNRITTNTFAKVLRAAYLEPGFGSEYVSHLAIGGVDGTLHNRFEIAKKQRLVRAKTGTLNDVTALSGYVLSPAGRPIAFSIVVNNIAGKVVGARTAIDKCVGAIVRMMGRDRSSPLIAVPTAEDE